MNKIATAYDGMKTDSEICNYGRDTDIPARRKMLATVKEIQARCNHGGAELRFAQKQLDDASGSTRYIPALRQA